MKTKNIFKALAMAMLMPAMLLTTACSNDDFAVNDNTEIVNQKGFTIPVTINVTRQGDDATMRATYTDNGNGTGTLGFSSGDKLLVKGMDNGFKQFSGILTWQSGGRIPALPMICSKMPCLYLPTCCLPDTIAKAL